MEFKDWKKQIKSKGKCGQWIFISEKKITQIKSQLKDTKVVDDTLYKYEWLSTWYPFAENLLGDLMFVSLEEIEYSEKNPFGLGEIFIWYHDENRIASIYSDIDDFLSNENIES